jgi:hypothetical protein
MQQAGGGRVMRPTRWASRASVGVIVGVVLSVLTPLAPASAASSAVEPPCSYGDAMAVFDSFATFVQLEGGVPPCQYRLYANREHFTFNDEDWFVGGVAQYFTYEELEQLGMTREEGIAELETITSRLWLAKVSSRGKVGTPIEQSLMQTAYKDSSLFGGLVYTQVGVILNLPPGDYLSIYEEHCGSELLQELYCGDKVFHAEVRLHVLSD